MAEAKPSSTSLIEIVRRLGRTLLAILETRGSLLAVEYEEERRRLLVMLVWAGATLFLGMMALILITATVVVLCPESARKVVLALLSLLYLALAIGSGVRLRRWLRDRPPPFAASTEQLKKDLEWLQGRK